MNEILKTFFSLSVSGSIIALVLFGLKPFLKDKFSKTWQYYIWLIVIIRLLFPFYIEANIVGQLFSETDKIITERSEISEPINGIPTIVDNLVPQPPQINSNETMQQEKTINYWNEIKSSLWLIWLGIAIMLLVRKVTSYHSFIRYIKVGINEVSDNKVSEMFKTTCFAVGLKKPLEIYTNPLATSAMLVGIYKPFVVIPSIEVSEIELRNIFIHELTHYKRMDIFYKWFTQLAVCLHWYNPLVYLVSREINKNCELSCDETIIRKLDDKGKRSYGDTLLSSLKFNGNYNDTIVSITLNEDAKLLKERLEAIMKFSRKSKLTIAFSTVLAIMMISGAAITGAYASTINIPTKIDKKEISITNTMPIMLNSKNYTYLAEINEGQLKSERVMFEIESSKAFLYLEIEDYSEPIGIKVFYGDTNNLVLSSLGATFAEGGVPGFFVDRGKGLYSVELIRSKEITSHNVTVYGVSIESFADYENITLPKNKLLNETGKENNEIMRNEAVNDSKAPAVVNYTKIIYEDTAYKWPYIQHSISNNSNSNIVSIEIGSLAFGKDGKPLELYWDARNVAANGEVGSVGFGDDVGYGIVTGIKPYSPKSYYWIHDWNYQKILSNETKIYGGWPLFDGWWNQPNGVHIANYLISNIKKVTFEDGTVWENSEYDHWLATYKGKSISLQVLQTYYPNISSKEQLMLTIPKYFTSGGTANTTQNANTYTYEGIIEANKYQFGNPFPANKGERLTFKLNSIEYVSGEVMGEDESVLRVLFGVDDFGNYNTGFDFKLKNSGDIGLSIPAYKTSNYPIAILNYSSKEVKYSFTLTIIADSSTNFESNSPDNSTQIINNVDVKKLGKLEYVTLGTYDLSEGDIIHYDVSASGNGNLSLGFVKPDVDPENTKNRYFTTFDYGSNNTKTSTEPLSKNEAGKYTLYVCNISDQLLSDIKGTVIIEKSNK